MAISLFLRSTEASISGFHPGDPGSIPGARNYAPITQLVRVLALCAESRGFESH